MRELLRVCQVLAVPRGEKVAPMVGRQGEVQSVTHGILRHDLADNVALDDLEDGWLDGEKGKGSHEAKALLAAGEVTALKLIDNGWTGHQLAIGACSIPPLARPLASGNHFRFVANLVIEARNRRLNVDSWFHLQQDGSVA